MKKITKLPAPVIIFWFCFLPAAIFTLVYEFILIKYPSRTESVYKSGLLLSKISYSMVASSIFYFISQYLPVFLPKEEKKKKVLSVIKNKSAILNGLLMSLEKNLGFSNSDYQDVGKLTDKLNDFNMMNKIDNHQNFESYYRSFRKEALEVVQSILLYHDYISLKQLNYYQLIEKDLLLSHIFNFDNFHLNGDIYFYPPMAAPTFKRLHDARHGISND